MQNRVNLQEFVFHRNHSLLLVISGIQTHWGELRSAHAPMMDSLYLEICCRLYISTNAAFFLFNIHCYRYVSYMGAWMYIGQQNESPIYHENMTCLIHKCIQITIGFICCHLQYGHTSGFNKNTIPQVAACRVTRLVYESPLQMPPVGQISWRTLSHIFQDINAAICTGGNSVILWPFCTRGNWSWRATVVWCLVQV